MQKQTEKKTKIKWAGSEEIKIVIKFNKDLPLHRTRTPFPCI